MKRSRRHRTLARCACASSPNPLASNPIDTDDWLRMGVALVLGVSLGYFFWKGSPSSVEAANTASGTTPA